MSEEESSSSDSEASDNVDARNLPEGAPRISSGALIEDGEEEQLRCNISRQNLQSLQNECNCTSSTVRCVCVCVQERGA